MLAIHHDGVNLTWHDTALPGKHCSIPWVYTFLARTPQIPAIFSGDFKFDLFLKDPKDQLIVSTKSVKSHSCYVIEKENH